MRAYHHLQYAEAIARVIGLPDHRGTHLMVPVGFYPYPWLSPPQIKTEVPVWSHPPRWQNEPFGCEAWILGGLAGAAPSIDR